MDREIPDQEMSRTFVLQGRTGDLINCLPLFHAESKSGNKPTVVVHKNYSSVLRGCSYVNIHEVEGDSLDMKTVPGDDVHCLQLIGDTHSIGKLVFEAHGKPKFETDSFAKEPYKLVDRMDILKTQPRPIFDKRNKKREAAILKKVPNPESTIIFHLGGTTSPFPFQQLLVELLTLRFKDKLSLFDLSAIKAEYIFDFLGLFSKAKCLIASDSALLHLAYAVPTLPVVALIQDRPSLWHGSPWRSNHIRHIRYQDFPRRAVEILEAIEKIDAPGSAMRKTRTEPTIFHVWSGYEINDESKPRHAEARTTWEREYKSGHWVETEIEVGAIGRDSKHGSDIKDTRRFPFLKDVLRLACYRATNDNDILCLTRSHTQFQEGLTDRILESKLPVWSHRKVRNGHGDTFHPACDLFAFTVGWWKEHSKDLPFVILSPDQYWNRLMFALLKKNGGSELSDGCFVAPWVAPSRKASPTEAYNQNHLGKYEEENGPIAIFPKASEQLPTHVVNRHALHAYAYNPSLIRWNDRWLMIYRFHDQSDYSTALAIAELDEAWNVKRNQILPLPQQGGSEEDAKFFIYHDQLHLSYVDSTYPSMPPKAVVKYGRLIEDNGGWTLADIKQPNAPDNDGEHCQKNWTFWEHDGELYCLYQATPHQILRIKDGVVLSGQTFDGLNWSYGTPRGGTAPIPWKGKLLRFFHSGLDNEAPPFRRRYYVGAMTLEPEPPFKPIAITKEPVLRGSELDDLSEQERAACIQYKGRVVFPLGAVDFDGKLLLSVGLNDASSAIVRVNPEVLGL